MEVDSKEYNRRRSKKWRDEHKEQYRAYHREWQRNHRKRLEMKLLEPKIILAKVDKETIKKCPLCQKKLVYPLVERKKYCNLCWQNYPLIIKNRDGR